jgi:hypothetical protein
VAAVWSYEALGVWLPGRELLIQATRLGTSIGIAVIVLTAAAWLLRIREFQAAIGMVTRRMRRSAR